MSEQYICINCLQLSELSVHGRCSFCNSDSVVSQERLKSVAMSKAPLSCLASNEQLQAELFDIEHDYYKFPVEAFLLLADRELVEDYYEI